MLRKIISKSWLLIFMTSFYLPVLFMFLGSVNENGNGNDINNFSFSWAYYGKLFTEGPFINSILLSVSIGILASLISVIIAFFCCLALSKLRPLFKKTFFSFLNIQIVNADCAIAIGIVFLFILLNIKLGFLTLLISHITMILPYAMFIIWPQIQAIKKQYVEASLDLGASWFYTIRKIIIPLCLRSIIIAFMIGFALSFDDFIFSFLSGGVLQTSSVFIYTSKMIRQYFFSFGILIFVLIIIAIIIYVIWTEIKIKIKRKEKKSKKIIYIKKWNYIFVNTRISYIISISKQSTIFVAIIGVITLICFFIINMLTNSITLFAFEGDIDSSTISDFTKNTKTKINEITYDTNENFYVKAKYSNYDIAMMSDYEVATQKSRLHKWSNADIKLFTNYYYKYNLSKLPGQFSDILDDDVWAKTKSYKLQDKDNLSDYFLPYSVGALSFVFNNVYSSYGKGNDPYKTFYDDAMNNKTLLINDDPRDIVYFGMKLYQATSPDGKTNMDINENGNLLFTKKNIQDGSIALNSIEKKDKNIILTNDDVPTNFKNGKFADAYINNYAYAYWLNNLSYKPQSLIYDIPDKPFSTNYWEDGFTIANNLSKEKTNQCIKFIAWEYSDPIASQNINSNCFYIPTKYEKNIILKTPKYQTNKGKSILILIKSEIDSSKMFTNNFEDYVNKIYAQFKVKIII